MRYKDILNFIVVRYYDIEVWIFVKLDFFKIIVIVMLIYLFKFLLKLGKKNNFLIIEFVCIEVWLKNIVKLVVKNIVKFVLKFILFVYIYNINKFYKYLLFNVN